MFWPTASPPGTIPGPTGRQVCAKNAAAYGLDPENLMLIGSSAGGHLVSSFAASPNEYEAILMDTLARQSSPLATEYQGIDLRPQKLTLAYPAISFMDLPTAPATVP